jgi:gliding motility-associated-like protein
MKFLTLFIGTFLFQFAFGQAGGLNCVDMEPICTDAGVSFTANEGGPDASVIDPGNDYGCLVTSPNPSWFYFEISNAGDVIMELSAPSDIDFIIWGPYTDLAAAQANCGNHTNIVPDTGCNFLGLFCDGTGCSFSTSNTETPAIPGAQVGEVYVMLVTNYANSTQQIDLVQTGGSGATDCTIINPVCNINFFDANVGLCDNTTGEYEINGVIEYSDAPITGNLIVEDCFGIQHIVASAPFPAGGSINYTISNMIADGAACDLTVYFSDDLTCVNGPLNYVAPVCNSCFMTSLSINISACDANGNFEITGVVEFTDPPTTGQLTIQDCNGNSVSYNPPFNSPLAFTIPNIPADGTANCNITAQFTDDLTCSITSSNYNNPANCDCTADIGTFTATINGSSNNNYVLCYGDQISIETNDDWVAPEEATNPPGPFYDPGVSFIVYSCPPTVGLTPTANVDIVNDPCFLGIVSDFDFNDVNDMSWINSFPGTFTDNTIYLVPITMYSITDGTYSYVNTTVPCYDMGPVFPVQYLPEIITNETSDCQAGTVSVEIEGGLPAIDGSQFTGSNLLPVTASFNVQSTGNTGSIIIEGLVDGDNYSFDIIDDNGCPVSISGVFQGVEDPTFDYPNNTYCQDETDPVANITGTPGGTFSAAPAGLSLNAAGTIDLGASTPGTYTVTYTTPDPVCFASSTYDITILPVPVFTLVGTDPSQCGLGDGTITISGLEPNTDYNLSYTENANPIGPQNITTDGAGEFQIGSLSTGTFENFVIELDGCNGSVPDVIQINDINAPFIDAGLDQEVCEGTDVTLTADNPDGASISWNNGVIDGTPFTPAVGSQVYTVTADIAGCLSSDQVSVTVHPNPTVIAGNDITICEGESVILTGSGANNYVWDNGVLDGVSFNTAQTTTYTVIGTTINGCIGQDDATVTVETTGDVSFDADNKEGCAPLTTTFSNTSNFVGSNCTWYLSDGTVLQGCNDVSYTFNNPGCYNVTLEVETANGCISSITYDDYICIDNDPIAMFTPDPFEVSSIDPTINFSNGSLGASDYHWNFGDGSTSTTINPNHTYPTDQAGEYEVQLIAYSPAGCTDTARAVIVVIEDLIFYVPNTFTPDNDDFNEVFKPIFTSGYDPFDYELLIFNRWGEIVFESNNASVGWDGTYGASSNRIVKDGTYIWRIEFKTVPTDERQTHVGHVNILK